MSRTSDPEFYAFQWVSIYDAGKCLQRMGGGRTGANIVCKVHWPYIPSISSSADRDPCTACEQRAKYLAACAMMLMLHSVRDGSAN